jgi:hypothetical protein
MCRSTPSHSVRWSADSLRSRSWHSSRIASRFSGPSPPGRACRLPPVARRSVGTPAVSAMPSTGQSPANQSSTDPLPADSVRRSVPRPASGLSRVIRTPKRRLALAASIAHGHARPGSLPAVRCATLTWRQHLRSPRDSNRRTRRRRAVASAAAIRREKPSCIRRLPPTARRPEVRGT